MRFSLSLKNHVNEEFDIKIPLQGKCEILFRIMALPIAEGVATTVVDGVQLLENQLRRILNQKICSEFEDFFKLKRIFVI